MQCQLRWIDHIHRMTNKRPVKALFYSELEEGTRRAGRPSPRYKDVFRRTLKRTSSLTTWCNLASDRTTWISHTSKAYNNYDTKRRLTELEKRALSYFKRGIWRKMPVSGNGPTATTTMIYTHLFGLLRYCPTVTSTCLGSWAGGLVVLSDLRQASGEGIHGSLLLVVVV